MKSGNRARLARLVHAEFQRDLFQARRFHASVRPAHRRGHVGNVESVEQSQIQQIRETHLSHFIILFDIFLLLVHFVHTQSLSHPRSTTHVLASVSTDSTKNGMPFVASICTAPLAPHSSLLYSPTVGAVLV